VTPTATPTATPPASANICDDFNRTGPDLGPDWEVKTPDFEIQLQQMAEVSGLAFQYAQVLWSGTTNTLNQFGRFQMTNPHDNWQGVIFRSSATTGDVGPHYQVHLSGSQVNWEYAVDATFINRPDTCTLSSPVQDGDWFGATITGTGNDTVVEVFISTAELGPDPNGWPLPVCSLTGNPSPAVDAGNRVGIRSYTSSGIQDTFMDDVCLGDSPTGAPTPTPAPTATPSATPTVTPSTTPTATPTVTPTATPTATPSATPTSTESNCCRIHAATGCNDPTCEATVCGVDPFCCNSQWDSRCVDEANTFCPVCGGATPTPSATPTATATTTPTATPTPTPEPGGLTALGSGIAMLALLYRRRA